MTVFLSASGECLSGALWWEDLVRLAEEVGFCEPRLVTASTISIGNEEIEKRLGKGVLVLKSSKILRIICYHFSAVSICFSEPLSSKFIFCTTITGMYF